VLKLYGVEGKYEGKKEEFKKEPAREEVEV
jgi:hypothetical protein